MPELATFVKFKVLEPENIQSFLNSLTISPADVSEKEYYISLRKEVIENFVFNLKGEVSEALRMMSRKAAEECLDALYTGCIMLNPGLDVDAWVNLSYTKDDTLGDLAYRPPDDTDLDDDAMAQAFLESIKNFRKGGQPKLDLDDFPFPIKKKQTVKKNKSITKQKFLGLDMYLSSQIIGQDSAIHTIVDALKRSQAGLSDEDRPLGVFLFAGSSGVGKTHLANALHSYLFGNDRPMVRIDCGEFQHKHENQKLIGSPPGYVGHDEGGQLVNLVKENPNTVVLLDEVEKAHPDIWNTFLRVFDDGILTDGKGEVVDFRNTIIIMTTNLGNDKTTAHLLEGGTGFTKNLSYKLGTQQVPERSMLERNTNDAIKKHFKPEFLNRIDKVVVFNYLSKDDCLDIARLEMSIIITKLSKKGFQVEYSDNVLEGLVEKGIDSVRGARGLSQIRREQIESLMADAIVYSPIPKGTTFHIDYEDSVFTCYIQKPQKKSDIKTI
jgi:ATP-dependent protease Clp ATPase subunit